MTTKESIEELKKKMEIIMDPENESCGTYIIIDEDHTLANSLRWVLMQQPEVEFCGYSIPHPSENKINFRVQAKKNIPSTTALQQGLDSLTEVCNHVLTTFDQSMTDYVVKNS